MATPFSEPSKTSSPADGQVPGLFCTASGVREVGSLIRETPTVRQLCPCRELTSLLCVGIVSGLTLHVKFHTYAGTRSVRVIKVSVVRLAHTFPGTCFPDPRAHPFPGTHPSQKTHQPGLQPQRWARPEFCSCRWTAGRQPPLQCSSFFWVCNHYTPGPDTQWWCQTTARALGLRRSPQTPGTTVWGFHSMATAQQYCVKSSSSSI